MRAVERMEGGEWEAGSRGRRDIKIKTSGHMTALIRVAI